jgi:V/A-type H+-transporting ATPase subunit D
MAKIKHTKNELKAQKEALTRFERFLPMLQLKKQQLQAEIQGIDSKLADVAREEDRVREDMKAWIRLFSEPVEMADLVSLAAVETEEGNIAGVAIPVLREVKVTKAGLDLFETPPWVDDAIAFTETLIQLSVQREILDEQKRLISEELRVTTQRVNLFEKVKIPECKENIRVIKIFLGDEQTAAVARGKIAKRRTIAYAYEDSAA